MLYYMPTLSACPINLVVDNHTFGPVTFPLKNDQDSIVTGILNAFNNEQYGKPNDNTLILPEKVAETIRTEPIIESMKNSEEKKQDNFFNSIKKNPEHYKIFKIIMIVLLIFVVFGVLKF
jgi:hypothetical protein